MNKQKLILPISIIIGCVILGGIYFSYEFNRQKEKSRQDIINNKNRLIELTIIREKIYWRCFSEKNQELFNLWEKSDEYKKAMEEKPSYKKDGDLNERLRFNLWSPEHPWQEHNEIASKFCSEEADNTQAGLLIKELRNKVPIEIITDDELRDIANKNRY